MTVKKISVAVAALGFMLTLTERGGGPWAGTFIGAALLILGALAALNAGKIFFIAGNKTRITARYKNSKGRRTTVGPKLLKGE